MHEMAEVRRRTRGTKEEDYGIYFHKRDLQVVMGLGDEDRVEESSG